MPLEDVEAAAKWMPGEEGECDEPGLAASAMCAGPFGPVASTLISVVGFVLALLFPVFIVAASVESLGFLLLRSSSSVIPCELRLMSRPRSCSSR